MGGSEDDEEHEMMWIEDATELLPLTDQTPARASLDVNELEQQLEKAREELATLRKELAAKVPSVASDVV